MVAYHKLDTVNKRVIYKYIYINISNCSNYSWNYLKDLFIVNYGGGAKMNSYSYFSKQKLRCVQFIYLYLFFLLNLRYFSRLWKTKNIQKWWSQTGHFLLERCNMSFWICRILQVINNRNHFKIWFPRFDLKLAGAI